MCQRQRPGSHAAAVGIVANPRQWIIDTRGTVLLVLILQLALASELGVFEGILRDTDVYMWLNRVLHLRETGDWFDPFLARINPPYGHAQHWTRPFDVLLLTGAWVGSFIFDFDAALYGWAAMISPALEILTVFALLWSVSPVFKGNHNDVLGILFVTQMGIVVAYAAGRADHQSLLSTLFVVSFGLAVRMLLNPFKLRWCYGAGLVSALALWVSVESILSVLITLSTLGLFWLLDGEDFARKLVHYTLSLFVGSALALLSQRGFSRLLEPDLDEISIAFILLIGLICSFWVIVNHIQERFGPLAGWRSRLTMAIIGAAAVIVVMEWGIPGFFSGPDPTVDELYRQTRMENIGEAKPLLSISALYAGRWSEELARFIYWSGIAIPGIAVLLFQLARGRSPEIRFWTYLAIGLVVFLPHLFKNLRWAYYVAVLSLPAYAWLIGEVLHRISNSASGPKVAILRVAVLVVGAGWFLMPGLLLTISTDDRDESVREKCLVKTVSQYLDRSTGWGDRPRNIVAFVDFGPELLYRTKHAVYSIPNHRYQQGYTDSYHMLAAADDNLALSIAERRNVELILICPEGVEDTFYRNDDGVETLHDRLSTGRGPWWLREVMLPPPLGRSFKLFEVTLAPDARLSPRRQEESSDGVLQQLSDLGLSGNSSS